MTGPERVSAPVAGPEMGDPARVRDAATVLVLRDPRSASPAVLMGQRGKAAAFMPGKFVFPGGAVDQADASAVLATPLPDPCAGRIGPRAGALAAAAIRELWEETGLALAQPAPGGWEAPDPAWQAFAARGIAPSAGGLRYVFRAITPPGRPRRFDARFLLADAAHILGDPDDFSHASDELSHLQWIPLAEARRFDLPFITEVVLAEIAGLLPDLDAPQSVPFFDNSGPVSRFSRIT